jgi:opacity protein-like surface antigen
MKKLFFTSMFLVIVIVGFSQTGKGGWLLGGNLSFSSISQSSDGGSGTSTVFQLTPKVGVFVINNLAVILNTSYTSVGSGSFSDHTLSIGPAARYYFKGSEMVKFFAGAGISFGSATGEKSTAYQFEAGPAFFITPSVALELNINYENAKYKDNQYNNTITQSQFGIGIGFMIYLHKNKK